ncbi:hypothetical protein RF11_14030 [Thelohanellus kitauei]|uniref:Uncharacterized protein n=1 Tax=Thelohanellus kitauei TaxID=669202 RepID=A0A0C2MA32_THEKT|nr:hypothetical protein RF11_14030 [Thelohanellus kitauei]
MSDRKGTIRSLSQVGPMEPSVAPISNYKISPVFLIIPIFDEDQAKTHFRMIGFENGVHFQLRQVVTWKLHVQQISLNPKINEFKEHFLNRINQISLTLLEDENNFWISLSLNVLSKLIYL